MTKVISPGMSNFSQIPEKVIFSNRKRETETESDILPDIVMPYKVKTMNELTNESMLYGKQLNQENIKYNYLNKKSVSIYLPGYNSYDVPENNANLIYSLVESNILFYYSMDPGNCTFVNEWIKRILCILKQNMVLLYDIEEMEFCGCNMMTDDVIIQINGILISSIVENIIIYILSNWYNPFVHVLDTDYQEKYGSKIPDIEDHIKIKDGEISFIDDTVTKFIMDILGIQNLNIVHQNDFLEKKYMNTAPTNNIFEKKLAGREDLSEDELEDYEDPIEDELEEYEESEDPIEDSSSDLSENKSEDEFEEYVILEKFVSEDEFEEYVICEKEPEDNSSEYENCEKDPEEDIHIEKIISTNMIHNEIYNQPPLNIIIFRTLNGCNKIFLRTMQDISPVPAMFVH